MCYGTTASKNDILIEQICDVQYYENHGEFHFKGENHDFWELQYVDKGEAEVITCDGLHTLNRGQAIFHKPKEDYTIVAAKNSVPNMASVSFVCHSPAMQFFEKRILMLSDTERGLLEELIAESRRCSSNRPGNLQSANAEKVPDEVFGAQQLIRIYLEQILISLVRRYTLPQLSSIIPYTESQPLNETYSKILFYLEEHIRGTVSVREICHDNLIGRSQLQALFQEQNGCGVIHFFQQMKVEYAKQLICEKQMNFTQISEFLGYSSVHYFSRQFKVIAKMTPSEYADSIVAGLQRA
ncbi:MAG: AraC family transcriptional regulator [Clostridiales bacterium]|nr:AraC family transcriptional regulator [Clostridiales bacterium]